MRSTTQIGGFLTRAARVRRRRAPRRRVHHLQHLLDHGRAAHAGVRDAALARSHPPPGPRRRRGRGAPGRLAGLGLGLAAGSASPGCSLPCSTPSASPSRAAAWCSRPARSLIALAVGVGVTVLAALGPHGAPLEFRRWRPWPSRADAGRQRAPPARRTGRPGVVGGAGLLALGLFGSGPASSRWSTVAGGAVLIFVGRGPRELGTSSGRSPPLIGCRSSAVRGPGQLARENAMRNPGRTAVTSAALMVGLGLVVFVAVFTAGHQDDLRRSARQVGQGRHRRLRRGFGAAARSDPNARWGARGRRRACRRLIDQVEVNGRSRTSHRLTDGVDPPALPPPTRSTGSTAADELLARLARRRRADRGAVRQGARLEVGDRYRIVPLGRRGRRCARRRSTGPDDPAGIDRHPATLRAVSTVRTRSALRCGRRRQRTPDAVRRGVSRRSTASRRRGEHGRVQAARSRTS